MVKRLLRMLLALFLAGPLTAQASLLGQTANCSMTPNGTFWSCSPASATVIDPGAEFQVSLIPVGVTFFEVDIGEDSILLTLISTAGLQMNAGEVLTLSGLSGILGASLNFTTATSGFDASDVSFTATSVTLSLNASEWSPGDQALIDVVTRTAIAEPGVLALLGLGLAGLAAARRRKQ